MIRLRLISILTLIALLLSAFQTPRAPGQARADLPAAPPPADPAVGPAGRPEDGEVRLLRSDNQVFEAEVFLPQQELRTVQGPDGRSYAQVVIPGQDVRRTSQDEQAGQPGIPYLGYLVAVPQGTLTVTLTISQVVLGQVISNTLLYPYQRDSLDQSTGSVYSDPPFERDEAAYQLDQTVPQPLVSVQRLEPLRGLELLRVGVAALQHNPVQKTLQPVTSLRFALDFQGGSGYFLPARTLGPFDSHFQPQYDLALNASTIPGYLDPALDITSCLGYELLIITAPDMRPAANLLAAWKWKKGIATKVVEAGAGAGQIGATREQIRAYIADQYDTCQVRLSYVLLIGDSSKIPAWPFEYYAEKDEQGNPLWLSADSDLPYTQVTILDDTQPTQLPDLAIGRIPAEDKWDAEAVVAKVIAYEQTPPKQTAFYQNMTFASYFQCCRTDAGKDGVDGRNYLETTEAIRDYMLTQGYTVQRIYNTSTYHQEAYKGDPTPLFYKNGASLPAALLPASGFAWDGDEADINAAFQAGRFLIFHRDHGNEYSWGDPPFGGTGAKQGGGLLPVIFGVECLAGNLLAPGLLMRPTGGAVGLMSATGYTPTGSDDYLAKGAFDAVWPGFNPQVGGGQSLRRLGDIMTYAKLYTVGVDYKNTHEFILRMVHAYGDPTLEMWTAYPYAAPPLPFAYQAQEESSGGWLLAYPVEGATLTLLQNGQPVGRAQVSGGAAAITPITPLDPALPVDVSASLADHISTPLRQTLSAPLTPGAGGSLATIDQRFSADFPSGAVQVSAAITHTGIVTPSLALPSGFHWLDGFTLDASSALDGSYTFHLRYNPEEFKMLGIDLASLALFYLDEATSTWTALEAAFDPLTHQASVTADQLGEFALGGQSPRRVYLPLVKK